MNVWKLAGAIVALALGTVALVSLGLSVLFVLAIYAVTAAVWVALRHRDGRRIVRAG